jgi:hypothetical protein
MFTFTVCMSCVADSHNTDIVGAEHPNPEDVVTSKALLYGDGVCFLWGTNWTVSTARSSQYLTVIVSRLSRQCGILNISQTYRPPRTVTGIVFFNCTHLFVELQLRDGLLCHSFAEVFEQQIAWKNRNRPSIRTPMCCNTLLAVCENSWVSLCLHLFRTKLEYWTLNQVSLCLNLFRTKVEYCTLNQVSWFTFL